MKLLLIYPPATQDVSRALPKNYDKEARSHLPPLGLLYLASYIREQGHNVHVIDMRAEELVSKDILSILKDFQPNLIGISCVTTSFPSVLDLINTIKECEDIPIVLGGPSPTLYPKETLQHKGIDYLICGCGQIPLGELCNQLEKGNPDSDILNCYTPNRPPLDGAVLPKLVNPDNFPFPDRTALPISSYSIPFCPENPTTSMISSIGCCFKCKFCNCKNSYPLQLRSPENVIREMKQVQRLGIRSIMFQDDLFTLNSKRVEKLCNLIIDQGLDLHWSIKSRVDCIKPSLLDLMKEAGCFNVHFGIESGNNKTLIRMNKGVTTEQARSAVQAVKDVGLSVTGNFMLGYPGESKQDVQNTISFAEELQLNVSQFSITMDAPGTELYTEAISVGRRSGDAYQAFILNPENIDITHLFSSDLLSKATLLELMQQAYSRTRTLYNVKQGL